MKQFTKLIDKNPNIDFYINSIINEYDIKSAHSVACYFIFGKEKYDELMAMDKLERNTAIGKMMRKDPTLHNKIAAHLLEWMNTFCEENNVLESNFLSSTRDSIVLANKKPLKTKFKNGMVEFRNKEGEYTSYIRINNLEIFFDKMSFNMRIKGIDKTLVDENKVFVKYLKEFISTIESYKNLKTKEGIKRLGILRNKYLFSKNAEMFRSLMDRNKFLYLTPDEEVLESDVFIEGAESSNLIFLKHRNYENFIMPLINIYFKLV